MTEMRKKGMALLLSAWMLLTAGCSQGTPAGTSSVPPESSQVASGSEMAGVTDVVEEGMVPVSGDSLKDGTYPITVDSSSSMFRVVHCELTVLDGEMTAEMTMGGNGYLRVFPGTGEEAAAAADTDWIPYAEQADGSHAFTVPVEALDQGIPCAAFSKKKEKWYDRTLLFRADSLPEEAWKADTAATPDSLGLADGSYWVDVALEGGSGRAGVDSPAKLTVRDGQAEAELLWSSGNYDYMKVDGTQYDAELVEGRSRFVIPVACFDRALPVQANTTAMSTPHEIDYTLRFDSNSLKEAEG